MSTSATKLHSPHGVCVCASLLGLFLWAILSTVSAARPLRYTLPTFLNTSVNITAYRGTDIDLPCAVRNLGPKVVVWKKFNQPNPITIGYFVYDPDSSYEILPKTHESPEWNLRINDVQMAHAGIYECQISTKEHFTRNVTLTVIDAIPKNYPVRPIHDGRHPQPDETGIRLEGKQFIEKGMPIVLNCTASAIDYRPKGVDWFMDGTKIKSDEHVMITESTEGNVLHSRLEILHSNMSDAGTYVCRSSKFHVASKKIIVLNTESINKRRGTAKKNGVTMGGESLEMDKHRSRSRAARTSLSSSISSSSVLLLPLFWPLLRAVL